MCLLGNNVHSWGPGRDPVTATCGNFIDCITCTAISKNTTAPPGRLCVIHLQYLQGAGACKFRGRSRSRRAGKAAALVGGDGEGVATGLGRAVHADLGSVQRLLGLQRLGLLLLELLRRLAVSCRVQPSDASVCDHLQQTCICGCMCTRFIIPV